MLLRLTAVKIQTGFGNPVSYGVKAKCFLKLRNSHVFRYEKCVPIFKNKICKKRQEAVWPSG